MREWLKSLDQIDLDCVHQYEYLLERKLKDHAEYSEIDKQVDEMILEWDSREEFFEAYPDLKKYAKQSEMKALNTQIESIQRHNKNRNSDLDKITKETEHSL